MDRLPRVSIAEAIDYYSVDFPECVAVLWLYTIVTTLGRGSSSTCGSFCAESSLCPMQGFLEQLTRKPCPLRDRNSGRVDIGLDMCRRFLR